MAKSVDPIPKGYEGATPYLCVKGAEKAIEFYKKAFGATEAFRMVDSAGKVGHAEIKIGAANIMLADEYPDMGFLSPPSIGGTPVALYVYVKDVDTVCKQAEAAGGKVQERPKDQFYGDRSCKILDPFGHSWLIATHIEDVPPAELKKRGEAMFKEHSSGAVG